jgi:glycosyltransferase involved in cell wall biosynthesis
LIVPKGGHRVLVVIPAYNEEATIGLLLEELSNLSNQYDLGTLVVDDGSADGTAIIARSKGARVLENRRNTGYGAALRLGLREAAETNADIVVTLDADGYYSVSDIPKLVQPLLLDQAEIVIGSRFLVDRQSRYVRLSLTRTLANRLLTWLANKMFGLKLTDWQSGFRAFKRSVIPSLLDIKEDGPEFLVESVLRLRESRIVEIPVRARPRLTRADSYLGIAQAWNLSKEVKRIWPLSSSGK